MTSNEELVTLTPSAPLGLFGFTLPQPPIENPVAVDSDPLLVDSEGGETE